MMRRMFLYTSIIACSSLLLLSAKENTNQDKEKGKEVYTLYCQSCHMENGEGLEGVYPPVAKTNYLKDTKKIIDVILKGQFGEITVNGKKYNTDMPAQAYLTDEQIADVLTYIRSSWGNKYPPIKPAQVKAQRK
jgi:mono/diheme cytochrome c family protein